MAVLAAALNACTTGSGVPTPPTAPVTRGNVTAGVSGSGSLSAVGTQNLGFPTGGKLTSVRVKVGDRVRSGQVLATVDHTAAEAALEQAESNLRAQRAGLDRLRTSTSVSGAADTVGQANRVVDATREQASATARADGSAIRRAEAALDLDEDAEAQAKKALKTVKAACRSASSGAARASGAVDTLVQQALSQLQSGDSAGAAETLSRVDAERASGAAGDSTACTQVLTAQAAVTGAKQKVVADRTGVVAARQKKDVDSAAGRLAVANARSAVVAAQNGLDTSAADRPHSIDQQQALVDNAEAAVTSAEKVVDDTTLTAPSDGTVEAINGSVGEYVGPSSGTTALAPGSKAAIPGASAASNPTGPTRPGGTQFLVLSNVEKLQLVLPFEQSDAAKVVPDERVTVQVDAIPTAQLRGHVVSVAPASTASSGAISYYATVALDQTDKRLRDGQTARGTVATVNRTNVLSVPNAAIHRNGGTTTVAVLAPNGAQQVAPVQLGAVGGDRTEVVSGLTEGQRVVIPAGAAQ